MTDDVLHRSLQALRDREATIQAQIEPLLAEQRQVRDAVAALEQIVGTSSPQTSPQTLQTPAPKVTAKTNYLTVIKAAERVDGISRETLRKAIRDGKITDTRTNEQGHVLVNVDAVRAYIDTPKRQAVKQPTDLPTGWQTVSVAARAAGVSDAVIRLWIKQSLLAMSHKDGRQTVRVEDVVSVRDRPQPKRTPPAGPKYDKDAVLRAARDLRVFSARRLADASGVPRGSIHGYLSQFARGGQVTHHGTGRGPGSYYVHADYKGAHDAEMARGEKPVPGAGESATEARARDFVVRQRSPFTAMAMATALGTDKPVADGFCVRFLDKGMLRAAGGTPDAPLFEYVKPTDPGPAAKTNGHHDDADVVVPRRGAPVAGTGRGQRMPTKEGRDLQDRIEKAGGRVEFGGKHPVVVVGDRRITLSGTPSDPRSRDNEIARLRREGLAI